MAKKKQRKKVNYYYCVEYPHPDPKKKISEYWQVKATSIKEAKDKMRKKLKMKRLPNNTQCYRDGTVKIDEFTGKEYRGVWISDKKSRDSLKKTWGR